MVANSPKKAQTYEQWLKTENERIDSQETERKTVRKMTVQKTQDVVVDQFRKNDKFTEKDQTLHQEVEQDETKAATDGDDNGCDDEVRVPKEPETVCSVVTDGSTVSATSIDSEGLSCHT